MMNLRSLLAGGALAALAVSSSHAAVSILNLTPFGLSFTAGYGLYIDVDNSGGQPNVAGQFQVGPLSNLTFFGNEDLGILFEFNEYIDFTATISQVTTANDSGEVAKLGNEVLIGNSSPVTGGNTYLEDDVGPWDGSDGVAYAGFSFFAGYNGEDQHFAWAELDYDDAANALTLLRIGYETTPGVGITTPSVIPETSSVAAVLGAAALGLVAFRRRR